MSEDNEASDAPELPADAQARIGARLRQMYDHVLQEPVPDRFMSLLNQLQANPLPGDGSQRGDDNNKTDR